MRAAVFESFQGKISIQDVQDPAPSNEGVVLKVTATGLCRSDWHGWMGHDPDIKLPHVPGHELAGIVVATGKHVKIFNNGDRVTVPFVGGCGNCIYCRSGNHQVCDHQSQPGFTHWGSFAEFVALDYADINLVRLPEAIDDLTASSLGCRFITAFRAVVHQAKVSEGNFVAIHGCGGVGLSAIMIAKALGAQVIAIDIRASVLKLAKSLGADHCIKAKNNSDVVLGIHDITKGGVHVSIDALGSEETAVNSINSLRKQGRHIQLGLMTGDHKDLKIPMDKILANELEIIGSHGMQAHKYPEMLDMILDGRLTPQKLISRTISLKEATVLLPQMNSFDHQGITVINSF
ncbi:MAG: zinc-dependent alcohol dehydrogenase family protein [Bacteroidia bacterium]|nr:zinc-dependent alcohol dehydrogenase family protein [Bacteroidia bacterium]NND52083.1 zinc-dependent alcohol dehydrogenase family protein [Flavobacteriaceae bacterium]